MYLSNVDCAVGGYVHTSLMWTVLPWWGDTYLSNVDCVFVALTTLRTIHLLVNN